MVKWQMRVYTHFFRAACINASILYGLFTNKKMDLLSFLKLVIDEWADMREDTVPAPNIAAFQTVNHNFSYWKKHPELRLSGLHLPEKVQEEKVLIEDDESEYDFEEPKYVTIDSRGHCKMCDNTTASRCESCNVSLCIGKPGQNSCWKEFHTCKEIQKKRKR